MDGAVEVVGGGGSHACCECEGGAVGTRSGGTKDGLQLLGVLVLGMAGWAGGGWWCCGGCCWWHCGSGLCWGCWWELAERSAAANLPLVRLE
jgi:hypothetical protein